MIIKSLLTFTLFSWALCIHAADEVTGGASSRSTVVAEIDGAKVTIGDFEQKHPAGLFQAINTYYQAERKAFDDFINEYILERQAQKEKVTVAQLLERHVNSTIPPDPSEEALRLYYEGTESKEPFEKMRSVLVDHIRETRIANAKAAYVQGLRDQAKVVFRLAPPRATVSLKDVPVRGVPSAPVTIVEYADYECPYCQQVQPALAKLEADYKGKVIFAYKNYPLPMHPHAEKAAEAALCAGAQGKYWEYHDYLFKVKELEVPQLKESAAALKLDTKAFDECLDSGKQVEVIKTQFAEGQALQIQGTPSFLINGRFMSGALTYDQFRQAVDEELSGSSAAPQRAAR